jgi:nitric oxide synthase oxygenase domain/subunit
MASSPGSCLALLETPKELMLTPISSKEIGVRDLADSFRYNVLPDVVQAIGWKHNGIDFDDLPDHDRLLWLSKAQAELNYAVQYSFERAKVTYTSTLTASKSWITFDDEHFK